jgi:hypothetical protein
MEGIELEGFREIGVAMRQGAFVDFSGRQSLTANE